MFKVQSHKTELFKSFSSLLQNFPYSRPHITFSSSAIQKEQDIPAFQHYPQKLTDVDFISDKARLTSVQKTVCCIFAVFNPSAVDVRVD